MPGQNCPSLWNIIKNCQNGQHKHHYHVDRYQTQESVEAQTPFDYFQGKHKIVLILLAQQLQGPVFYWSHILIAIFWYILMLWNMELFNLVNQILSKTLIFPIIIGYCKFSLLVALNYCNLSTNSWIWIRKTNLFVFSSRKLPAGGL